MGPSGLADPMLTARSNAPLLLVVDDDAALLAALAFALGAEGYGVSAHGSAQAALEARMDRAPACLVVDYRLPDMDGLALARALRRRGLCPPIVLITSHPDARCRARAEATGAVIVEKPLLGDALSQRIAGLLHLGAIHTQSSTARPARGRWREATEGRATVT